MKNLAKILIALVIVLSILGAILVFSASGTYSAVKFNSIYTLFKSHVGKVLIAAFGLVIFSSIPYENYRHYSKHAMLGVIILLLITLLFSQSFKGAARWIDIGLFRFQPSELAKVVLLVHLANMIERQGSKVSEFKSGLVYPMFWIFTISLFVFLQPNVSTTVIITLISFVLLYVGGASFKHVFATLGSGAVFAGLAMMALSHSRERILTFVDSLMNGGDINMQVKQAKIALGSGGFIGVGLGHSRQSDLFLPESYGDFIFSVLGEETGFLGAIIVLLVYLTIFFVGILIAKRAKDTFGQLIVFGLSFNIVISALINAAVVVGILPTTGITLPFISFGGTSIIIFAISIGIIVNVALQTHRYREPRLNQ
ncbi:MAG: FtsW/RodA/SpoVE family cell cycle protein [Melioribacteraceae bacterium]|nr:FtsW/RodA/SpoVE family cell cycle protein [Melioribacteraceae bacterium]MCF8354523.1 FtsW/RodA/SpoVE family cell cycle protein [Melioribacteraceae bacterium]MCF8394292.1 FtsW/RodA/SpoVE family cell cycle protein [Melioribacteraceae bacterium]MCF8418192.1 FtsW/RodA/SpoVE family cell cycle protein [Melioribacteraceae bacterium]